ncbi:MAG: hypothetical protein IT436_12600 [Phycisphaerales bacterium]|nr:hypothetical protein [Phycisphaerales bacterium]
MSEPASEVAVPVRRLSWWRRVILFVLEVNPAWWGSARLWALVVALVFLTAIVAAENGVSSGFSWVSTLPLKPVKDNQWQLMDRDTARDGDFAHIEVHTHFASAHRWSEAYSGPMSGVLYGPRGASRPIAGAEARVMVRDALARLTAEEFRNWMATEEHLTPPDYDLWERIVYDGRAEAFSGSRFWWYLARQSDLLRSIALIGFLLCFAVGFLRSVQRRTFEPPLALIAKGRCPRCRYDMTGAPTRVCPECGTDVEAVEREARAALE